MRQPTTRLSRTPQIVRADHAALGINRGNRSPNGIITNSRYRHVWSLGWNALDSPALPAADHITARSVVLAGEPFRPAVGNTKTAPLPFSICVPFFGLAIATKALIRSVHSLWRSHRVRIAVGMIAACRSTATVETAPESKTVWVGRSTFEVSYRAIPAGNDKFARRPLRVYTCNHDIFLLLHNGPQCCAQDHRAL